MHFVWLNPDRYSRWWTLLLYISCIDDLCCVCYDFSGATFATSTLLPLWSHLLLHQAQGLFGKSLWTTVCAEEFSLRCVAVIWANPLRIILSIKACEAIVWDRSCDRLLMIKSSCKTWTVWSISLGGCKCYAVQQGKNASVEWYVHVNVHLKPELYKRFMMVACCSRYSKVIFLFWFGVLKATFQDITF